MMSAPKNRLPVDHGLPRGLQSLSDCRFTLFRPRSYKWEGGYVGWLMLRNMVCGLPAVYQARVLFCGACVQHSNSRDQGGGFLGKLDIMRGFATPAPPFFESAPWRGFQDCSWGRGALRGILQHKPPPS